ncbi:Predicted histidine transporter YuiF [Pseudomonas syringae pv. actinidiae]|uniref:Predicted histidine transporter YuiF n=1 Tax=Pseudomonas syringae pv. actinidiae TaxID=103796 RepID=A0A2V0QJ75_PSESF|nr:Predicted histidine transporter YuiF [Pseudomonas syringae pv. actinidiae]
MACQSVAFPALGLFDRFHRGFSRPFSGFVQGDKAPVDRVPCSLVFHIKVPFYKLPSGYRVAAMESLYGKSVFMAARKRLVTNKQRPRRHCTTLPCVITLRPSHRPGRHPLDSKRDQPSCLKVAQLFSRTCLSH